MISSSAQPPALIATERLRLRRIAVRDAPELAQAITESRAHLQPWLAWATKEAGTTAVQRIRCERLVSAWNQGDEFIYHAWLPAAPVFVGSFGLHRRNGREVLEIGYWVHAARAGRGYATEAAHALTTVALPLPGIDRVEIHCDEDNVRSAAIPAKLGYRLDRIEARRRRASAETGRHMIWVTN